MGVPSEDKIIINTDYVHSVGVQVKNDATKFMGPEPDCVQDFHDTLTQFNTDDFPKQLSSTFSEFINIHTAAFTQIFQDRQNIGDALQDIKNAAEENEINTMASFNPTPSTALDGPTALTIVK